MEFMDMSDMILFSLKNLENFKLEGSEDARIPLDFDPCALKGLTRLKRLSITGFNIDSPLESSLFNDLVCLEELNFRENNLDENTIPNDAFDKLVQLKTLNLSKILQILNHNSKSF